MASALVLLLAPPSALRAWGGGRLRSAFSRAPSARLALQVVDLFPDPPSVGGKPVVPPPSAFPSSLGPSDATFAHATLTPFPTFVEVVSAPLQPVDFAASILLAFALLLGPDFLLAPAGLVSDRGIRPGYSFQRVVGGAINPDGQWLRDRREGLKSQAPLNVQAIVVAVFLLAGFVLERLLLVSFEDASFIAAIGGCSLFGGGLLEVIREPLPTREERDMLDMRRDEFYVFAADKLQRGGSCHETDVIAAFRAFYPRYRRRDMSDTIDGISLSDKEVGDLVRSWNMRMGRPGERTPAGYWKGFSVCDKRGAVSDVL